MDSVSTTDRGDITTAASTNPLVSHSRGAPANEAPRAACEDTGSAAEHERALRQQHQRRERTVRAPGTTPLVESDREGCKANVPPHPGGPVVLLGIEQRHHAPVDL